MNFTKMAVFQHIVEDENVNTLNRGNDRNTDAFDEKNTTQNILSIPHILKEKLLASTRSGPLMVYSEYIVREATSRRLDATDSSHRTTLYNTKQESRDDLQNEKEQDDDELQLDDATLDEIMQFRSSSSDGDEEMANKFPCPVSTQPYNFRPTIATGKLPTIFEVASSQSEDTSTQYLSHDGTEIVISQESIDFEEMCFKRGMYEDSIEAVVFDVTLPGKTKLGVLLMHA